VKMARVWMASLGLLALAATSIAGWEQSTANAAPTATASKVIYLGARSVAVEIGPVADLGEVPPAGSVIKLDAVPNLGNVVTARMFATTGGSDAGNKLLAFLVFDGGTNGENTVFFLGHITDYRILSSRPGRIELEVRVNEKLAVGDVRPRVERASITWTIAGGAKSPARITII
jgi:hypothetical protein